MKRLVTALLLVGLATASCSGGGSSPSSPPLNQQAAPTAMQANFPTTESQVQAQSLKTVSDFLDSLGPSPSFTGGLSGALAYPLKIGANPPINQVGPSCTGVNAQQYKSAAINIPGILTAPTAFAYFATKRTATSLGTVSRSGLQQVKILSGAVTADEIQGYAVSAGTANTMNSNASFGSLLNVKVLGVPVPTPILPNTVITIPLVGTLTLNGQKVTNTATSTTADQVQVQLKLLAGTVIKVGTAHSSFTRGTTCP